MKGTVVVTGASSGIGASVAKALLKSGFRVCGTVRQPEDAAALETDGITPVLLDVTSSADIARARAEVEQGLKGSPLVGLVNNAGTPSAGPLELMPVEEVRRVLEVNVVGLLAVTQAFLPALKAARGRVVNMSSLSGRVAFPFLGPYSASKFAVEALSDCLRRELSSAGVGVIVVQPASIRTPIWDKVEALDSSHVAGTMYESAVARVREDAVRGGRHGLPPERVAQAVLLALTAKRPPTRIPVVRSRLRMVMLRALPDRWLDAAIARRVGMTGDR